MEDHKTLQTGAVIGQLTDAVQAQVDDFLDCATIEKKKSKLGIPESDILFLGQKSMYFSAQK